MHDNLKKERGNTTEGDVSQAMVGGLTLQTGTALPMGGSLSLHSSQPPFASGPGERRVGALTSSYQIPCKILKSCEDDTRRGERGKGCCYNIKIFSRRVEK